MLVADDGGVALSVTYSSPRLNGCRIEENDEMTVSSGGINL